MIQLRGSLVAVATFTDPYTRSFLAFLAERGNEDPLGSLRTTCTIQFSKIGSRESDTETRAASDADAEISKSPKPESTSELRGLV